MSEVKFVEFNGIKEYARVIYNDVKDADKYRIEVAYNGRDVKDLLEYLFELEQKLQQKENIIKEVREFVEKWKCVDGDGTVSFDINTNPDDLLKILDKGE